MNDMTTFFEPFSRRFFLGSCEERRGGGFDFCLSLDGWSRKKTICMEPFGHVSVIWAVV